MVIYATDDGVRENQGAARESREMKDKPNERAVREKEWGFGHCTGNEMAIAHFCCQHFGCQWDLVSNQLCKKKHVIGAYK